MEATMNEEPAVAQRTRRLAIQPNVTHVLVLCACVWSSVALADFDHRVPVDDTGIWSRTTQNVVRYGGVAVGLGGALWLGGEDPLGRTFWQSVDAMAIGQVTAEVAKRGFGRRRPSATDDPGDWFNHGSCCRSFPSGEVTLQASLVTPFIVNHAAENPWVWALEVLPAYDAIARVKAGAHWQTDVLAGWALGTAIGYWAAKRDQPLFLQVMPGGIAAGIHKQF
jgi:membrane-associated phospholipid phosphatase